MKIPPRLKPRSAPSNAEVSMMPGEEAWMLPDKIADV